MCSYSDGLSSIRVKSSMILNSPGFPTYPTSNQKCSRELMADPGMALRVYVLAALFKGNQNKYKY